VSDTDPCPALSIAVRAYAKRPPRPSFETANEADEDRPLKRVRRRYPSEALIFDTETLGDPAQQLMVGVWRFYRDRASAEPGRTCVEEGLFYPDELPDRDPNGYAILQRHVDTATADVAPGFSTTLLCEPLSWWLEERFYRYGYSHRNRCLVVAYNLPFDLGRIASEWKPATGRYRGGFSLGIWGAFSPRGKWKDAKFHPRLRYKAIDPRRTLFSWGSVKKEDADGLGLHDNLLDLHTLVFALTDKNLSLQGACNRFGDPWEKTDVGYGEITPEMLTYAREDVEHTALLYRNALIEVRQHEGIDLQPAKVYSPATVGSRYLDALGVTPPEEKFELPAARQGYAISAFFGGRAEARIVRTFVPVAYVDATSMYPSINALLGTWDILRARSLVTEDATGVVRKLLVDRALSERCYERDFWSDRIGVTLVELDRPTDQVLPVRGWYDPDAVDPRIGVNPLTYNGPIWYFLPDVIASVLLSGHAPEIRRAIRFRGVGIQRGLRAIALRGGPQIDPRHDDPFVAMIEQRRRIERDTTDEDERERLSLFLKITANATSYGVLARFDRKDLRRATTVRVYGPDRGTLRSKTDHPEDPGPHCFPAIAASLTAGARLVLAMLERAVTEEGGSYAFCDTDSMAIVATPAGGEVPCRSRSGPSIHALSASEVRAVLDRFQDLNPFDRSLVPNWWKAEHRSLDEPITCYAISAKRYVLLRGEERLQVGDDEDEREGAPEDDALADWSEHGLGIYLDPYGPEYGARDDKGRRVWVREAWDWVLERAGGGNPSMPPWASLPALTRFTISSPAKVGWFAGHDDTAEFEARMRPGSFGLLGQALVLEDDEVPMPATNYEPDPGRWGDLVWYDRRSGEPIEVTWAQPGEDPEAFAQAARLGAVAIRTLGQVLAGYLDQAEHKSAGPNGEPASDKTTGVLSRRRVQSGPVLTNLIGKEGSSLAERAAGELAESDAYGIAYGDRADRWEHLLVPVLRLMGVDEIMKRTERSRSSVFEAIAGRSRSKLYLNAALDFARATGQRELPADAWAALYCFCQQHATDLLRLCQNCGRRLPSSMRADARYCSGTCRQASRREATARSG